MIIINGMDCQTKTHNGTILIDNVNNVMNSAIFYKQIILSFPVSLLLFDGNAALFNRVGVALTVSVMHHIILFIYLLFFE